jgi:predicted nucleic acid-binding protein
MKSRVYIETSIVSYLTARPSRDLIVAAQQQISDVWWSHRRDHYDLFISELVIEESGRGDGKAAADRLSLLADISLLETTTSAVSLAERFLARRYLPDNAAADALHIALATVHQIDYLLTWNCRHIANAEIQKVLRNLVQAEGYNLPILCTPSELMGENDDVE